MTTTPITAFTKDVLGWWFAASNTLPHGDGRRVVIGETLHVGGKIVPCQHGLHASVDPFDALQYAPGATLYRVRLSGTVVGDGNKHAASDRTALAVRDATDMLRLFARRQALSVIHLWDAPPVVREYLETGDESKRAAAAAASDAAAAAAARDAAARDAAAAARAAAAAARAAAAAARAATRDAAAAARDAARAAARAATRDAARAAARAATRAMFGEMVVELFAE